MKRKDLAPDMIVFVSDRRDYLERDGLINSYGKARVIYPAVKVHQPFRGPAEYTALAPGDRGYTTAPALVEIEKGFGGKPLRVAMPLGQIIGHYEIVAAEIKAFRAARDDLNAKRQEKREADVARAEALAADLRALLRPDDPQDVRASRFVGRRIELSLDMAAAIVVLITGETRGPFGPSESC